MVKVVLDSKSHQAIRHQGTEATHYFSGVPNAGRWRGQRLTGFEADLSSSGYAMTFVDLDADTLDDAGILVISGRFEKVPFSPAEMATITAFFHSGGSLLLMANHETFVEPQNQVAEVLGLPIRFHERTILEDRQSLTLCKSHPISEDCQSGLRIRTSCSMTLQECSSATVVARNEDPEIGEFAVAVEREGEIPGRAVAMVSGGHISSCDDSGTDLWAAASNSTWMLNVIDWLANRAPE